MSEIFCNEVLKAHIAFKEDTGIDYLFLHKQKTNHFLEPRFVEKKDSLINITAKTVSFIVEGSYSAWLETKF
jgi:hypothetical protein